MTCLVRLTLAPHLGRREHAAGGSAGKARGQAGAAVIGAELGSYLRITQSDWRGCASRCVVHVEM